MRGSRPGPTLCVVAGIHGDEINSSEIARRLFASTQPDALSGTLVVVPAAPSASPSVSRWPLPAVDHPGPQPDLDVHRRGDLVHEVGGHALAEVSPRTTIVTSVTHLARWSAA